MLDYVPLNDSVNIIQSTKLDDYGIPINSVEPDEVVCRIKENTDMDSVVGAEGETIVYRASILMRGNIPVDYDDSIEWEDGLGNKHTSSPISIRFKKDLSGFITNTQVVV